MHSDKDVCFIDGVYCEHDDCEQCRKEEELWLQKWLEGHRREPGLAVAGMPDPGKDKRNQP